MMSDKSGSVKSPSPPEGISLKARALEVLSRIQGYTVEFRGNEVEIRYVTQAKGGLKSVRIVGELRGEWVNISQAFIEDLKHGTRTVMDLDELKLWADYFNEVAS
jgi:hypothetical protein